MDFLTKKESNGLISDLKASEIAINAEKEQFQRQLIEQYGKEMEIAFERQSHTTGQINPQIKEIENKKKKCWLKRLFSI